MNKNNKKPTHKQKIAWDMSNLYLDTSSVLHCDKCKQRLGILHTLRYSLFKPQGFVYLVPCKRCGHINERTKGAYKQEVNERWKDFEKGK